MQFCDEQRLASKASIILKDRAQTLRCELSSSVMSEDMSATCNCLSATCLRHVATCNCLSATCLQHDSKRRSFQHHVCNMICKITQSNASKCICLHPEPQSTRPRLFPTRIVSSSPQGFRELSARDQLEDAPRPLKEERIRCAGQHDVTIENKVFEIPTLLVGSDVQRAVA